MRRILPIPPPPPAGPARSPSSASVTAPTGATLGAHDGAAPAAVDDDEVDLDEAYALPASAGHSTHVRSNFVVSIDGAAEVGGRSGPLGGPGDWRVFRLLRWLSDVVLVGAGTVRTEDYGPVVVPPERREQRVAAGLAAVPPVAVVSRALSFDPTARLFSGEVRPLLLTCEAAPVDRRKTLAAVADIVICGAETVQPGLAVQALNERGLTRVLTEGGPLLHAELAAAGLLDELCLTIAPVLAGPGRLGIVQGVPWPTPTDLTLGQVLTEDGVLFLRYQRREPSLEPTAEEAETAEMAEETEPGQ